jgi:beta-mannanase
MAKRNFRAALRRKTCRYCGEDFYAKRSDAQFCTASCKQKNHLDKQSAADYMDTVKFQLRANKETDEKVKQAFLDQIEDNLNAINDPDKHKKFQKLLSVHKILESAKVSIADIFALEQQKQVPLKKLNALIDKIGSELTALKEKDQLKHHFLIELHEMMLEFLQYLASEYELTRKNALNIQIPVELREDLISGHAKIKKMME